MPGGRGRIRKKNKRQDRDVSFRFHSGGSLESAAYLSEGSRDSPVFSDSLDEQEELAEDSKHVSTLHTDDKESFVSSDSVDTEDQNLVRELLESAIDDTNGEGTHFDRPLSDPLFEFEQEPFTHQGPEKEAPEKVSSTKSSPTKELEYRETFDADEQPLADSEGFSDSGEFMSIKEEVNSGIESKPTEVDRLLDSDDEELFLSMTKETIASVNETNDDKCTTEIDYADMRSHELELDNDLVPVLPVSPFKGNALTGDDVEDTTLLAEVDTHPLIRTTSAEDDVDGEIKEDLQSDEHDHQLLLSEEHFSNIPGLVESPNKDNNLKVKPKRPPPPRPPLPSKMGTPNIVVSGPTNNLTSRITECNDDNGIMVKPEPFHEPALSSAEVDEDHDVQRDRLTEDGRSSEVVRDDSLPLSYFVIYTIIVFLYYSLNPSSYLAGFLTGFLFFFVTSAVGFIWYVNYLLSAQQQEREAVQKSLELSNQQLIDHLDDQLYFKKINKFGIRFDYNPGTHHYSDNTPAHVKLEGFILTFAIKRSLDSEEHAQQNSHTQDSVPQFVSSEIVKQLDLHKCSVTLVPDEIAHNRKRRWSKKFPICISNEQSYQKSHSFYLFTPTAKVKEMWFRRLKLCSEGITDKEIALEQNQFFSHMKHYMPKSIIDAEKLKPEKKKKKKGDNSSVHYSMKSHEESEEEDNSAVSITKKATSVKVGAAKKSSIPPAMADMDWLNTALARICWDIWHEKRWHDWVEERIKRRISRIKTPSWMEPLSVADVQLGKDIPIVKRIYAPPKLNSEGVWIYLAVQYKGSFTMTLETKLRLGKKDETDPQQQQPHVISGHSSTGPKKPSDRYGGNQRENSGEEQPALIHKRSMPRSISSSTSLSSQHGSVIGVTGNINADSDIDSGSDDEMSASSSLSSSPNISQLDSSEIANATANISPQTSYPSKPAKWKNMLGRLKNSTIVQKAANTRIVRMAAEKMSSYNLYLTVEVKALDGFLTVNMSPPPSDILWYGFQWKPRLDLSAKPKLGQREVTLHYVTEWIENKLKELLEKQMVLPNMESIVIPIMNSGILGDVPYKLPKLSSNPKE